MHATPRDARLPRTRGDGPRRCRRPRGAARGFPAHAGMDPVCSVHWAGQLGLPRTRGDGPVHAETFATSAAASPHTRGWTRIAERREDALSGFPAHAGMDPTVRPVVRRRRWLPRTRGDGPGAIGFEIAGDLASPHTRGWTPDAPLRGADGWGFPAHAGMDRIPRRPLGACKGLPRTRGDGPEQTAAGYTGEVASPHTRGWTPAGGRWRADTRGFPAHAGMDPRYASR